MRPSILTWPARGSFLAGVASVGGGTALAHCIALGAAPVLTRLYLPSDFGVLAVINAVIVLSLPLACGRYHAAIPLAESDHEAQDLAALSLMLLAGVTVTAAGALFVTRDAVVRALNAPELLPYLWLVPFALGGAALIEIGTHSATREQRFGEIFRSKLGQAVLMIFVQLLCARTGAAGLVAGDAVSRFGAGSLLTFRATAVRGRFRSVTWGGIRAAASRYRRFPLLYVWSSLLNVANVQIVPLLMSSAFGSAVAGQFSLANRVVFLPLTLIGQAVAAPFYARAVMTARERPEELLRLVSRTQRALFFSALLPVALVATLGPWLFSVVFGDAWVDAGRFARVFVAVLLVQLVFSPVSQLFNIFDKQHVHLIWSALLCIATFMAVELSVPYGPMAAVIALTCVNVTAYGIGLALIAYWLRFVRAGSTP